MSFFAPLGEGELLYLYLSPRLPQFISLCAASHSQHMWYAQASQDPKAVNLCLLKAR